MPYNVVPQAPGSNPTEYNGQYFTCKNKYSEGLLRAVMRIETICDAYICEGHIIMFYPSCLHSSNLCLEGENMESEYLHLLFITTYFCIIIIKLKYRRTQREHTLCTCAV